MNILIISTQNPFRTSGIVAYNLYRGLKDEKNNVKVLLKPFAKYDSEDFISFETPFDLFINKWKSRYERLIVKLGFTGRLDKTNPDYHIQDYDQTVQYYRTKVILKRVKFQPDVIIYLFQQNFLTAKNLYELNKLTGAKIFWYLMDTAPLTGACHYSWDCNGYMSGCGNCPALYSNNEKDQSSINLKYKSKYLSKTNIEIIAGSEWLRKQAASSLLFKNKPIHKVLLSIDPSVFSYVPKLQAKEKLGIPIEKRVIFFGATSINDTRKGMKYLVDALHILKEKFNQNNHNVLLLIAGHASSFFDTLPYEIKHLGLLANNELLAAAYQAADIFVCPSIEDAGPMMINQSIMTGTPVVSFEMGVALDLVITGETGYRAKLKDSADFARALNDILQLDKKAYRKMCTTCRELGLRLYHPSIVKGQFNKLFISEENLHAPKTNISHKEQPIAYATNRTTELG
jgi:glycosyltransferase involved in cell wall biosynthesis